MARPKLCAAGGPGYAHRMAQYDPYERLAAAIVFTAYEDYLLLCLRKPCRKAGGIYRPMTPEDTAKAKQEIRAFLDSNHPAVTLAYACNDLDAEVALDMLDRCDRGDFPEQLMACAQARNK